MPARQERTQLKTTLFVSAALLLLSIMPGSLRSAEPSAADVDWLAGARAFNAGDDRQAADLVIRAVRADRRCLGGLIESGTVLPETACSGMGQTSTYVEGDPAAQVLYLLAQKRKGQAKHDYGPAYASRAGRYYLEAIVEDHKGSPWEDDAALLLVEDGFCQVDTGCPACVELSIRGYEGWLQKFSLSDRAPEVIRRTAQLYLVLAERYERDEPWNSPVKAELCRGMALGLAELLVDRYPGSDNARWAERFAQDLKDSGKSYSMVPPSAVPSNLK